MRGYYGTIESTDTGERVAINYSDGFRIYGDDTFPARVFEDFGDGRLYEYESGGKISNVRWEWVTQGR